MNSDELYQTICDLRSRGEIKRFAGMLEKNNDLRCVYYLLLQQREIDTDLPIKKTIRMLLSRSSRAQERKNPIHLDTSFQCHHCNAIVPKGGKMIRDHCCFCLRGLHLDIVPGDRASTCKGVLEPTHFEYHGDTIWIHYICSRCQKNWRVRAHPDDNIPKSLSISDLKK